MQTLKAEIKDFMGRSEAQKEICALAREAATRYEEALVSEGLIPKPSLSSTGSSISLGLPSRHISAPAAPQPTSPAPEKPRFMSERRISSSQIIIEIHPADDSPTASTTDNENNQSDTLPSVSHTKISSDAEITAAPNKTLAASSDKSHKQQQQQQIEENEPREWAERSTPPPSDRNNQLEPDVVLVPNSAMLGQERQRAASFWASLTHKKLRPMEALVVLSSSATFSVPSTSRTLQEQRQQEEEKKRHKRNLEQQEQQQQGNGGKTRRMRSRQFSASVFPEKEGDDTSSPDEKRKPLMERARVGIRRMSNQFKNLVKRS